MSSIDFSLVVVGTEEHWLKKSILNSTVCVWKKIPCIRPSCCCLSHEQKSARSLKQLWPVDHCSCEAAANKCEGLQQLGFTFRMQGIFSFFQSCQIVKHWSWMLMSAGCSCTAYRFNCHRYIISTLQVGKKSPPQCFPVFFQSFYLMSTFFYLVLRFL